MVKFKDLDFKLYGIPTHLRTCYIYEQDGKTYATFSTSYMTSIIEDHPETYTRTLQATNYLYVPFRKKKIISVQNMLFELYDPVHKQT